MSCIRQHQGQLLPFLSAILYADGIISCECMPSGSAACWESSVTSRTQHADSHGRQATILEHANVIPKELLRDSSPMHGKHFMTRQPFGWQGRTHHAT